MAQTALVWMLRNGPTTAIDDLKDEVQVEVAVTDHLG
jgi:hypothetical protein